MTNVQNLPFGDTSQRLAALKQRQNRTGEQGKKKPLFAVENWAELMAKTSDEPKKQLAGSFWHEKELCVFVGQTGVGKSAVALDLANRIATGKEGPQLYGFEVETDSQKVLYFDFENDPEEQKQRTKGVQMHPNLFRVDFSAESDTANPTADDIIQGIKELLNEGPCAGCRVVILDNVSYLFDNNGRDMHEDTKTLMKSLNQLRKQYDAAFLVIAHRNKGDFGALTINAVAGSSNMTRFAQSCFGIAEWAGEEADGRVYFRQIKYGRARKKRWTSSNVLTGRLSAASGMLRVETSSEHWNESALITGEGKSIAARIREELEINPKATGADLARKFHCTSQNVNQVIKRHNLREEVDVYKQSEAPF